VLRVVRKAELAQAGERLRGEGLVQLDRVEIRDLELQPLAEPPDAGTGPIPMTLGGTPAEAAPRMRARGVSP
jgi:hypothetical protein